MDVGADAAAGAPRTALAGRRIVVTRPRDRAAAMRRRLERLGAEVLLAPVIVAAPPDDWGRLDLAIERLAQYEWVVLTSAQGVDSFVERLFDRGRDVRALGEARLAAIGSRTAERLRELGLRADLVPSTFRAEALAEALIESGVRGKTVLLPRSAIARPVLAELLSRAGAFVDEVPSYSIRPAAALPAAVIEAVRDRTVDMLTFTSASTVDHFVALAGAAGLTPGVLGRFEIGCIGPITADAVRRHGLEPAVVADEFTVAGLVAAVAAHYEGARR